MYLSPWERFVKNINLIDIYFFVLTYSSKLSDLISLGWKTEAEFRNLTVERLVCVRCMFKFQELAQMVFQSGFIILHSRSPCMKLFMVSSHEKKFLSSSSFLVSFCMLFRSFYIGDYNDILFCVYIWIWASIFNPWV